MNWCYILVVDGPTRRTWYGLSATRCMRDRTTWQDKSWRDFGLGRFWQFFCSVSKLPLGLRNICLRGLDLSMLLVGWFRLCLCRCFLKVVQMCSPLPGLHDMTYHSRRKKLLGFLDFSWWRGEIAVRGAAGRNLTEICTSLSSLLSCWSHLESKDRQLCRCSCNCWRMGGRTPCPAPRLLQQRPTQFDATSDVSDFYLRPWWVA